MALAPIPDHRVPPRAPSRAPGPASRTPAKLREGGVVKVEVVDNQLEPALKTLKKLMLKGGIFKEMKRRAYYEKPSVRRKRKQAEARRKRRKALRRHQSDDE